MLLATARAIDAVNDCIGRAACWLTLLVVLVATANAILRYGFHFGANGLLELQWYMFALIFLFGAAFTLARGGHVRVDVLYGRQAPRRQAWIDILGCCRRCPSACSASCRTRRCWQYRSSPSWASCWNAAASQRKCSRLWARCSPR